MSDYVRIIKNIVAEHPEAMREEIDVLRAKLDIATKALTELSYEHETSLYRAEMYEIAKTALLAIQVGVSDE